MKRVVVLTGGVGGAKLVLGLSRIMAGDGLTAIVNTGDDFRHLGLHISPDIDTLLYTLSGTANGAQGWGREGESWSFMAALRELGRTGFSWATATWRFMWRGPMPWRRGEACRRSRRDLPTSGASPPGYCP